MNRWFLTFVIFFFPCVFTHSTLRHFVFEYIYLEDVGIFKMRKKMLLYTSGSLLLNRSTIIKKLTTKWWQTWTQRITIVDWSCDSERKNSLVVSLREARGNSYMFNRRYSLKQVFQIWIIFERWRWIWMLLQMKVIMGS